jgi:exodeoxyribonuclease-3
MAEGRVLTVELPDCYIVNAYVPNAGQKLERLDFRTQVWEPVMLEYLHILEVR